MSIQYREQYVKGDSTGHSYVPGDSDCTGRYRVPVIVQGIAM
jgi:hypothetical protein